MSENEMNGNVYVVMGAVGLTRLQKSVRREVLRLLNEAFECGYEYVEYSYIADYLSAGESGGYILAALRIMQQRNEIQGFSARINDSGQTKMIWCLPRDLPFEETGIMISEEIVLCS